MKYAFYHCEDPECMRGFAVEDTPDDQVEEPACPACGCDMARLVGVVAMPFPLPIEEGTNEEP